MLKCKFYVLIRCCNDVITRALVETEIIQVQNEFIHSTPPLFPQFVEWKQIQQVQQDTNRSAEGENFDCSIGQHQK